MGFTLVELLIVTALVAVIGVTVVGTFASGVRLWSTLRTAGSREDINIFFARVAPDIRQALLYKTLPFQAEGQEMTFMTYIQAPPRLGGDLGIGSVTYRYDPGHRAVVRQVRDMHDLHEDRDGVSRELLKNVQSFELTFFGRDEERETYGWYPDWPPAEDRIPMAVRMTLTVLTDSGRETFTRTIPVHAGY